MNEFRIELAFDVVRGKEIILTLTDAEKIALVKKYLGEGLDPQVFFPDYEPSPEKNAAT